MSVLGTAFIEILPNTAGFTEKLEKDVRSSVERASKSSGGAFNTLANVGQKALLGLGAAAISGGALVVHLADAYEASHARLVVAFHNAGSSVDAYSKQIAFADQVGEKFGLSQDQTEGALARLAQATNDPKKALADLSTAVNLAAARHIDLEQAATIVGRVAQGNVTILNRYGIQLNVSSGTLLNQQKAHDALARAQLNLTAVETRLGTTHVTTAAQSASVANASTAITKANLALQSSQANLATVENNVALGKLKGVAASSALEKAHNAVSAATLSLSSRQQHLTLVQGKLGAAHQLTASQAITLQKAHDAVALATTKVNASAGAAGTAMDLLAKRFGGSAQAQAETFHGKLLALEAKFKDIAIHVGQILVPIIEKLASSFLKFVNFLETHKPILFALAALVGTVLVAAIGAYIAKLAIAATQSVIHFATMIGRGVAWVLGWKSNASQVEKTTGDVEVSLQDLVAHMDATLTAIASSMDGIATDSDVAMGTVSTAVQTASSNISLFPETVATAMGETTVSITSAATTSSAALEGIGAAAETAQVTTTTAMDTMATTTEAAAVATDTALGSTGVGLILVGLSLAVSLLASHWKAVWGGIQLVAVDVWHFLDDVIHNKIVNVILAVIAPLLFLVIHWKTTWEIIKTVARDAKDAVETVFRTLVDTVLKAVEALLGLGSHLPFVGGKFKGLENDVKSFQRTVDAALGGASDKVDKLGDKVGAAGQVFKLPPNTTGGKTVPVRAFDTGGMVNLPRGVPQLAVVHGGEAVLSADVVDGLRSGRGGVTIHTEVHPSAALDEEKIGRVAADHAVWRLSTAYGP